MSNAAVIVAAGRGERAGGAGVPKQYSRIGSDAVIARAIGAFAAHRDIDVIKVVIGAGDEDRFHAAVAPHPKIAAPVVGAGTRQGSVRRGLEALAAENPDKVLIHDAARPFVTGDLIDRVLAGLNDADAVVPMIPVASTLRRVSPDGAVGELVPREGISAAQTPQGFSFAAILAAHRRFADPPGAFTDDAAVAAADGRTITAVRGSSANDKITTAEDLARAREMAVLSDMARLGDIRVGAGYDVHATGPGSHVMLGGVAIEHTAGLIGHSDADVILHALTDAILGALGDGDIGAHFPPSDPRWRGAASSTFLDFAAGRVRVCGGVISYLDVTFIGEGPKLGPYRDQIRARIAEICGIDIGRVGVKATTSEKLGFIGRGEGLAANATATIRLPVGASHATPE